MDSTNVRYEIFSQMKKYDEMASGCFAPYSMLSGPHKYQSSDINTDKFGFRLTKSSKSISSVEDLNKYNDINIIVGGSTVFGVGCLNDCKTIPSLLQQKTGEHWLNFGIRGCNSLQEYIHLISHLNYANNIKNIIFVSGINDLYLSLVSDYNDGYDMGFGVKYSKISTYHPYHQSFAIFFAKLYGLDFNDLVKLRKKQMIFPFKKIRNGKRKKLKFKQKVNRFLNQYERNFKLYEGLKKPFKVNKIKFIFQPLVNWSNKKLSSNEKLVLDYLNKNQTDSPWNNFKADIEKKELFLEIDNAFHNLSKKTGIKYFNSNSLFDKEINDCFVDSVHLTDFGNKKMSELILKIL